MKKEYRAAVQRAIKESDLNGYTWTVTPDGLEWSYGETFRFSEGKEMLSVYADSYGGFMLGMLVGPNSWDDAKTLEEAYYKAAREVIYQANNLY